MKFEEEGKGGIRDLRKREKMD